MPHCSSPLYVAKRCHRKAHCSVLAFVFGRFSRLIYGVVRMADGSIPTKRDFKKENFEKTLNFLDAPEAWRTSTMDFIKQQYGDVQDARAAAICALTRLQGVAEFGYERGVFERPFWLIPTAAEVRNEVRIRFPHSIRQDHGTKLSA